MRLKIKFLFLILFASCSVLKGTEDTNVSQFDAVAEWNPQQSIWLAWPVIEPVKGSNNVPQIVALIKALTTNEENVDLLVNSDIERRYAAKVLRDYLSKVKFHLIKHTDFWMRDVGSIFVLNQKGELGSVGLKFNEWGTPSVSANIASDSEIDEKIHQQMSSELKIPDIASTLVMEGGGLEFNGEGTVIVTESVILQKERNPNVTKTEVESELKRLFGVTKVIWLKNGLREDDSTYYGPISSRDQSPIYSCLTPNGHTDEFVRWINPHTILLAEVTKEEAEKAGANSFQATTRSRLEANYYVLSHSTTQDGKLLTIIRIPVPETILKELRRGDGTFDTVESMIRSDKGHEGEPVLDKTAIKDGKASFVVPTSYLNYLVTNRLILMPKYWKEGRSEISRKKDELAKSILSKAFPDRKVLQIDDIENCNLGGGGIHAMSKEMPIGKTDWL